MGQIARSEVLALMNDIINLKVVTLKLLLYFFSMENIEVMLLIIYILSKQVSGNGCCQFCVTLSNPQRNFILGLTALQSGFLPPGIQVLVQEWNPDEWESSLQRKAAIQK